MIKHCCVIWLATLALCWEKREISYDIEPLTKELLSRFMKLQLNPTTWDLIELFWINYPFCFPFEHLREKDTYGAGELISFFPEDNWNEMVHNWDLNYPHCNFLDKAKKWEVETFGNRSHYNSRADYYTRVIMLDKIQWKQYMEFLVKYPTCDIIKHLGFNYGRQFDFAYQNILKDKLSDAQFQVAWSFWQEFLVCDISVPCRECLLEAATSGSLTGIIPTESDLDRFNGSRKIKKRHPKQLLRHLNPWQTYMYIVKNFHNATWQKVEQYWADNDECNFLKDYRCKTKNCASQLISILDPKRWDHMMDQWTRWPMCNFMEQGKRLELDFIGFSLYDDKYDIMDKIHFMTQSEWTAYVNFLKVFPFCNAIADKISDIQQHPGFPNGQEFLKSKVEHMNKTSIRKLARFYKSHPVCGMSLDAKRWHGKCYKAHQTI